MENLVFCGRTENCLRIPVKQKKKTNFRGRIAERCVFDTSWGDNHSTGGQFAGPILIQHKQKNLNKYWGLTQT